ncbi:unnamed protein product [Mytilus coruscus]|uniref:Uncharacterized protein n=1 Tax=Mytilus coruscus TaxID=42192 RepID=A0A6J8A9C5_MYTCO|nr:unnamed protein product [Mytilus coruscus]
MDNPKGVCDVCHDFKPFIARGQIAVSFPDCIYPRNCSDLKPRLAICDERKEKKIEKGTCDKDTSTNANDAWYELGRNQQTGDESLVFNVPSSLYDWRCITGQIAVSFPDCIYPRNCSDLKPRLAICDERKEKKIEKGTCDRTSPPMPMMPGMNLGGTNSMSLRGMIRITQSKMMHNKSMSRLMNGRTMSMMMGGRKDV